MVGILGFTISVILLYFLGKLTMAYFKKRLIDQAAMDQADKNLRSAKGNSKSK